MHGTFPASLQDTGIHRMLIPGTLCRAKFRSRSATIPVRPITNVEVPKKLEARGNTFHSQGIWTRLIDQ